MTREETLQEILKLQGNNFLLELPTGYGKSKIAIKKVEELFKYNSSCPKVLIVHNRIVHKDNWENEIIKWRTFKNIQYVYTTYASLAKESDREYYAVIYDECHHLSQRCRDIVPTIKTKYNILLSATVGRELKTELRMLFNPLICYQVSAKQAIEDEVLPDPGVYLIPLALNDSIKNYMFKKRPKATGTEIRVDYKDRRRFLYCKNTPLTILCTQYEYYQMLSDDVVFWKTQYEHTRNPISKNKWMQACSVRLKWLANIKTDYVKSILDQFKNRRTLTFCGDIKQTEDLGKYCINSKNKESEKNLKQFNEKKIKHITACNMLNEGMNLVDCQIGIYANLNSSETIVKQRLGRILRHKRPIIIIPYWSSTREEEIVEKIMLRDYNPDLVHKVTSVNEIKI